jgi:hypothetical protein
MTRNVENPMLDHLRGIRGDIASPGTKVDNLTVRVGSPEDQVAGMRRDLAPLRGDLANPPHRVDQHGQRMDRFEERLELSD